MFVEDASILKQLWMLIKSALRSLVESPYLGFGFAYATVPCEWVQEPNLLWLQVEKHVQDDCKWTL